MRTVGAKATKGINRPKSCGIELLETRRLLSVTAQMITSPPITNFPAALPPRAPGEPVFAPGAIPILHSFPGAPATMYLDFDGEPVTDWGGTQVPITDAYTVDNDPTTFTVTELSNINEIWARVSEKYSPFNIDVTTEDPGQLTDLESMKVVIGGLGTWLPGAGGVAYLGSFSNGAPNTAWVFS